MPPEPTIKDKKLITNEYVQKLEEYILKNQATFFKEENHAVHWRDFNYWPGKQTDRHHLVMPDECLLIDRDVDGVHCYVICRILGKSTDTKPKVEHVAKVIEIQDLNPHHWRNGYFLLPVL